MRGWLSPGTPRSSQNYTNYPVLFGKSSFFFSKFEDSINRRKRILWKEGEAKPRAATPSGGLQLAGAREVCSWRRPPH